MTATTDAVPRRSTPTERLYDALMASLDRKPSPPESAVTISRNARGVFQFEVTARGGSVEACRAMAQSITAKLVADYPYPVSNGGSE